MKPRLITSITEVRQAVRATGSHFFDADAMRSFQCRLSENVYPTKFGTFFVTSERDRGCYISSGWIDGAWGGKRRYTVRFVACRTVYYRSPGRDYLYSAKRGDIVEISRDPFGRFATSRAAHKHAAAEQARLNGLKIGDKPALFPLAPETEPASL